MGVFQEQVPLFNRAPIALNVQFDGQSKALPPLVETLVPQQVVQFAKNQNPIMGTQDPYNPHISGCRYLVGVVGTKDPVAPLTPEEWNEHLNAPCRENVQQWFENKYGSDPKAKLVTHGKGRPVAANSRYDAGSSPAGNAEFSERS